MVNFDETKVMEVVRPEGGNHIVKELNARVLSATFTNKDYLLPLIEKIYNSDFLIKNDILFFNPNFKFTNKLSEQLKRLNYSFDFR